MGFTAAALFFLIIGSAVPESIGVHTEGVTEPPMADPTIRIWNPEFVSGNISSSTLVPGDDFRISVNITDAPEFDKYSFNIEYHPAIIQFLDGTFDSTVFWPHIAFSQVLIISPGVVWVTTWGTGTVSGTGSLLHARFKVLETGLSIISITNSMISLEDAKVTHRALGGCFSNRPPRFPKVDFSMDPSPGFFETSEYMVGKIAIGIILPESIGPRYNWTELEVSETVNGIKAAMDWWASQEPNARMSFFYDEHVRVPTKYEPIEMALGDDWIWILDVLNQLGYDGPRAYNNAIRQKFGTDWAFTIFVADSDPRIGQGLFLGGGGYAHALRGGPWITMSRFSTYAWNWPNYYPAVPAHEIAHIFRATDEYNGVLEYEGYLWLPDADGSFGIMNRNDLKPSVSTKAQMGLVDCDGDGVIDLLDTEPALLINSPPPTIKEQPVMVSGKAMIMPYPSHRLGGRDTTIAKIARVEYSVDQREGVLATASDGAFDEALEEFHFNLSDLPAGTHIISVKATTSVGNSKISSLIINVTGIKVDIDVKPGSEENRINLNSNGVIPVAVLTTSHFNALNMDPTTVKFGATRTKATPVHYAFEDVDSDGDLDTIFHFKIEDTALTVNDSQATLTGSTLEGVQIVGIDSIHAFVQRSWTN